MKTTKTTTAKKLTLGALKAHRTRKLMAAKATRDKATKRELLAAAGEYAARITKLGGRSALSA